jgi:hypothetical protein
MWKRRKEIEGVSLGSMVALKATVFEKQQEAKRFKANPAERKLQVLEDIVDFSFFFFFIHLRLAFVRKGNNKGRVRAT